MASTKSLNENGENNINREEIQLAIAKAVELRALHAALMQGNSNSPSHLRFISSNSPPAFPTHTRPSSQFSGHDYPVFTPSYEDEHLPGYNHIQFSKNWEERYNQNTLQSGLLFNLDQNHICPPDDCKSVASSCTNNHLTFLQNSPGTETIKSRRRNSLGDLKSVSSCNKCKPANIIIDHNDTKSSKFSNMVVPLTDSHATINGPHKKSRGLLLSWLFKRKNKNENSSIRTESEEVSQVIKELGNVSIEALKKELIDANQKKEAALMEVSEVRSSFGELRRKLENLESYCEDLKKALKQAVSKREKPGDLKKNGDNNDNLMPVSEEVMVEGFLQIVSEARLSVKQFCKTLIEQIEDSDEQLTENLNALLKPYKLSLNSRYSKGVFYHLEAIINQALYQDFENCVFQKNGIPKILDPHQQRLAQFQSFASLRNLSWNEVLKKGTKYYSEEFSKFCDQKMSCIIMTLNWTRPWSETLLQTFFVAAKCIWLLHLLAFSFYPALSILRVEDNRQFDGDYMEDIVGDKQKGHGPSRVKVMVMPGFYVHDKILRCKVLCRYKSVV